MSAEETEKMAPTMSFETLVVVRPIKVLALLFGVINVVLLIMSIGASAWVGVDGARREGLWETCYIVGPGRVDCISEEVSVWVTACRALCILTMVALLSGNVILAKGLSASSFSARYRFYYVAMLIYFLGVLFEATALIIFPVKYSQTFASKEGHDWSFGWAYGLGWGVVGVMLFSSLLLCIDKDADEIIYREKEDVDEEGIEEEKLILVGDSDKSETESDIAYADEYLK